MKISHIIIGILALFIAYNYLFHEIPLDKKVEELTYQKLALKEHIGNIYFGNGKWKLRKDNTCPEAENFWIFISSRAIDLRNTDNHKAR